MPGVSIGNIGSPPPPAAPADHPEAREPAGKAVPDLAPDKEASQATKDNLHADSVSLPKKARK